MASTRNRNTTGDYELEKKRYEQQCRYSNGEKSFGLPVQSYFPGHGLMPANICRNELTHNACDVESQLFGIGANNLVTPQAKIEPQYKKLKNLDICDKPKQIVMDYKPFNKDQRPMYIN